MNGEEITQDEEVDKIIATVINNQIKEYVLSEEEKLLIKEIYNEKFKTRSKDVSSFATNLGNYCCDTLASITNESLAKNKYYFHLTQQSAIEIVGEYRHYVMNFKDIPNMVGELPKYTKENLISKNKRYTSQYNKNINSLLVDRYTESLLDGYCQVIENKKLQLQQLERLYIHTLKDSNLLENHNAIEKVNQLRLINKELNLKIIDIHARVDNPISVINPTIDTDFQCRIVPGFPDTNYLCTNPHVTADERKRFDNSQISSFKSCIIMSTNEEMFKRRITIFNAMIQEFVTRYFSSFTQASKNDEIRKKSVIFTSHASIINYILGNPKSSEYKSFIAHFNRTFNDSVDYHPMFIKIVYQLEQLQRMISEIIKAIGFECDGLLDMDVLDKDVLRLKWQPKVEFKITKNSLVKDKDKKFTKSSTTTVEKIKPNLNSSKDNVKVAKVTTGSIASKKSKQTTTTTTTTTTNSSSSSSLSSTSIPIPSSPFSLSSSSSSNANQAAAPDSNSFTLNHSNNNINNNGNNNNNNGNNNNFHNNNSGGTEQQCDSEDDSNELFIDCDD